MRPRGLWDSISSFHPHQSCNFLRASSHSAGWCWWYLELGAIVPKFVPNIPLTVRQPLMYLCALSVCRTGHEHLPWLASFLFTCYPVPTVPGIPGWPRGILPPLQACGESRRWHLWCATCSTMGDSLQKRHVGPSSLLHSVEREATGTWHGATSHLETAAAWPHVQIQSQICLCAPPSPSPHAQQIHHLLTSLVGWARLQKSAGVYTFELSARVYSFDKYLLSLYGERDRSLDSVLKFGMEKSNHVRKLGGEDSVPAGQNHTSPISWWRNTV